MRPHRRVALVALLVLAGASASAQTLRNSRHDLSASSTAAIKATTETQLCIFCHTPHKARTGKLLWNRQDVTGVRGWGVGNTTSYGTPLPTDVRPESKRCLSCHDGTIALGNVVRRSDGTPGTIAMTSQAVTPAYLVGADGAGSELFNNHPVSIPYAGHTYNGITSSVLAAPGAYIAATTSGCVSPSGICTVRPTDGAFINLRGTATSAGIECTTCHDAHAGNANPFMLRVTDASSRLCLACHDK